MTETRKNPSSSDPMVDQLRRGLDAVGALICKVRSDQWSATTPCTDWTVRRLVDHLIGMNRVFTALLLDAPPPSRPTADHVEQDPVAAYQDTAEALLLAFARPGTLARNFSGPLGSATGAERLQIRLYDLLAHGWDLAEAIGQPAHLPEDLAEQSLAFVRAQLSDQSRTGRFGPIQQTPDNASAIDRLAAFLGRPITDSP